MGKPAVAGALAALLACGAAAAQGLVEWHEQVVPGACTLRFAVPQGWSAEARTPARGAVGIRLVPPAGAPGEVTITGTALGGDAGLADTGGIKRSARAMGEALLPDSVERRVELERVDGTDGVGFFYTLTDKRGKSADGGLGVVTQGIMAIGELRLAVTVRAGERRSPAAAVAFDLLRTAECQPARR